MSGKNIIRILILILLLSVLLTATVITCLNKAGIIEIGTHIEVIKQEHIDEELLNRAEKGIKADEKGNQNTSGEAADDRISDNAELENKSKGIIVLDPGHGVSSSTLTDEQKRANGWIYSSARGGWGEWRHFKSGAMWRDCEGVGCSGRAPENGGCWYPISAGDRSTEPEINLNNALAAKKYLEQMGYDVRITRGSEGHPSMTKRLEYCYPDRDITKEPDADVFVCLHSNAGGGKGSYYIALSGLYDQAEADADYIESGNTLGKCINDRIVSNTGLTSASGGRYEGYPELVLFCKSPITIAYMEIGFFDNESDLTILKSNSDGIGRAIADGINDYMNSI